MSNTSVRKVDMNNLTETNTDVKSANCSKLDQIDLSEATLNRD